jgi:hypothetical protein
MKHKSYPKMLYRPAISEGNIVWGARVDTKTVNSRSEHVKAKFAFWLSPHTATKLSKVMHFAISFFTKHSNAIIAAILALIVGIILFHYQENNKAKNNETLQQESIYESQTLIT